MWWILPTPDYNQRYDIQQAERCWVLNVQHRTTYDDFPSTISSYKIQTESGKIVEFEQYLYESDYALVEDYYDLACIVDTHNIWVDHGCPKWVKDSYYVDSGGNKMEPFAWKFYHPSEYAELIDPVQFKQEHGRYPEFVDYAERAENAS